MHPKLMAHLLGAGFFDKFTNILNTANKVVSGVSQAVDIGKKAIDVGKNIYGTYKSLRGGKLKNPLISKSEYKKLKNNKMLEDDEIIEDEGGKLVAGSLKSKSKRKLPEALRKRAIALGKYMKQGHSMKEASKMFAENGY